MYDEVLMEHNLHPEFYGKLDGVLPIKLRNNSCGDELSIYLRISGGVILDGRFSGVGCAISKASADLFIASIIGKKLVEAKKMSLEFSRMILGEKHSDLGPAEALSSVSKMPARANCAKLAWKSLEKF